MVSFEILIYGTIVITSVLTISPEFDDKFLYGISWNDPLSVQEEAQLTKEKVFITTQENEKYQCVLPQVENIGDTAGDISDGPSPEVLISDVLKGDAIKCSFRLEPYWTYELCHGNRLLQFHEEKDEDGALKRSEFTLGTMTKAEVKETLSTSKPINAPGKERRVPTKKIHNKDTPYFSVVMDNGTPCDLNNGKPRKTTVLYICHPTSNNEIMSVKETTTCEYEAIVLTPVLCGNPVYLVKDNPVHDIKCHALPGSPSHPLKLNENIEIRQPRLIIKNDDKKKITTDHTDIKPPVDKVINQEFLKGTYCLHGGTGWWRYEFCHGRHIMQYHQEHDGSRTEIIVGRWNEKVHLNHIKNQKLTAKLTRHVVHVYSQGDICDLTGKNRLATVSLICKPGPGQQISIYMTEKQPCVYTVGIESPILCPLIKTADENGLFKS